LTRPLRQRRTLSDFKSDSAIEREVARAT